MHIRYQVIYTLRQKTLFFQNCLFLFLRMKKDEPKIILFVIFHYGLDHGLQLKSYLNLIMKSNYWLLQVEKG
jgi:hypothetical protein